jgi:Integrase core domain
MAASNSILTLELQAAKAEYIRAQAEARYMNLLLEESRRQGLAMEQSSDPVIPLLALSHSSPPPAAHSPTSSVAHHRVSPSPATLVSLFSHPHPPIHGPTRSKWSRPLSIPSNIGSRSAAVSGGESTQSTVSCSDEQSEEQPARRKRRCYRSKKLNGMRSLEKPGIVQRRLWLVGARGNKESPVTHRLQIPAWYHPELDELSPLDGTAVVPVEERWMAQQRSTVEWFTKVLRYHAFKVCSSTKASTTAAGEEEDEVKSTDSDWEQDYKDAVEAGWGASEDVPANLVYTSKSLMMDRLYLELVKVLMDPSPTVQLMALSSSHPSLHKVIQRQLDEHARYHLFWSHVDVCTPGRPEVRHTRLIPVLFRVEASCHRAEVTLQDCKRCIPLSQIGWLLDRVHSGGAHLKDGHSTLSIQYCGIPRKAIRLFAAKCQVCNRHERKKRNKRPPRAIKVEEVRQRYTLDLIDLQSWQLRSTGLGRKKRYIAHIIDHSSKYRWAEAIHDKTAVAVLEVVRRVFRDFGQPALLHTDNGTEFANAELEAECRRWGTYIIHGRPYHPESQGVVENPNGVLKRAMAKFASSNEDNPDWTWVLSQVLWRHNTQVHSTTRMSPEDHFRQFNFFSREVRRIPDNECVVISVKDLASIERLRWVTHCDMLGSDVQVEEQEQEQGEEKVEEQVEEKVEWMEENEEEKKEEGDLSEEEEMQEGAAPAPAPAPLPSGPTTLIPSPPSVGPIRTTTTPASGKPFRPGVHILEPGVEGVLNYSGTEWEASLVPQVRAWLRRWGGLANGNCGPATAYALRYGRTATAAQASAIRREVLDWSETGPGQLYYADHALGEIRQVPKPLQEVQEVWRKDRQWVSPEFFTCFGGMMKLNVFLLCRTVDKDGDVHCGIALVTNGGTLIKTDEDNICCVYFQSEFPSTIGHFEAVRDTEGRYRWGADDRVLSECLWASMLRTKVARSVRDTRQKMLTAAHNRVNLSNETISIGDCVWLTVPEEVVKAVSSRLKKKRLLDVPEEDKLLVRVGRVVTVPAGGLDHSPLSTQHFILWCEMGQLEGTYSIDELKISNPPPESAVYRAVDLDMSAALSGAGPKHKPIPLTKAYSSFLELKSARVNIAQQKARTQQAATIRSSAHPPRTVTTSSSHHPAVTVPLSSQLPMVTQAEAVLSSPPPLSAIDLIDSEADPQIHKEAVHYPCTHCKETLLPDKYVFCFYRGCQAPFHKQGGGCPRQDKAVVVDSRLFYCRQACASLDRGVVLSDIAEEQTPLTRSASSASAAVQVGLVAALAAAEGLMTQSQPTAVGSRYAPVLCVSCQKPVQWKKGAGCDRCRGYHCKVPRGKEGCTREGWSKGGSLNVAGITECVACRFDADPSWKRFCDDSMRLQ